jgi:hypothetical protein
MFWLLFVCILFGGMWEIFFAQALADVSNWNLSYKITLNHIVAPSCTLLE